MNITSVDDYTSTEQFEAHYRSLPRIVLEGQSDVKFFKVWFESYMSELDFVSSESISGAEGCTAVADAVRRSLDDDGIPAIGVVDRDRLNHEHRWGSLFSTSADPPGFEPDGGNVYTTALWEIEAYLLRPELMKSWVGMQRNPPPATDSEKESALGATIEEGDALLSAMPFFASAHAAGVVCHVNHFAQVRHDVLPGTSAGACAGFEGERLVVANAVETLIQAVRDSEPIEPANKLVYLLRYVDTRRLLQRIGRRLGLHDEAHHALQELMSMTDTRPEELKEMLEIALQRFAE